ncbi:MAG: hypothetical protein CVV27_10205 [Candidatus Melainabacteria bacterium HGW-Melainabacteria-1]|nr:MAG: hypothetical protein CVV27_10205 [Candidatus Melainabacteria bacterium HGW-Melainabacteria-1]
MSALNRTKRSGLPKLCLLWLLWPIPLFQNPASAQEASTVLPETSALPEHISIKTATQSFNSRYDYALHQGRIWWRPHRAAQALDGGSAPSALDWRLMPCQGLPCQPENADFPVPQAIVSMSADGDELTAIDGLGRFYFRTMAGQGLFSKTEWTHLSGFPKGVLKLPWAKPLAWSMGRRHFDVLWYEDADGNPHHVGTTGTSTLYLLSPDGSQIRYTDNGLPADFSRSICGPERGRLRLKNIQASAATLFAIDASGQTYTRMDDFDINGGTSMFIPYTYKPQPLYRRPSGAEFDSHLRPWRLPPVPWRAQPQIVLSGQARLSTAITILQTGQGNAARELRVAGINSDGRTGYYTKMINAEAWTFYPAALAHQANHWLTPGALAERLPADEARYAGKLKLGSGQDYPAELYDLNPACSPARLRLELPSGAAEFYLHLVEAWSHARCEDPTQANRHHLRLGTLEALPNQTLPPALVRLDRAVFALPVSVDALRLVIYNQAGDRLGVLARKDPDPAAPCADLGKLAFERLMFQGGPLAWQWLEQFPELLSFDLDGLDSDSLKALIAANQALLDRFELEAELIAAAQQQAWAEAIGTLLLRNLYLGTGMCWWMPYGPAFCRSAPPLMLLNWRIEDELARERMLRYDTIHHQLQSRLERYRQKLRHIEHIK